MAVEVAVPRCGVVELGTDPPQSGDVAAAGKVEADLSETPVRPAFVLSPFLSGDCMVIADEGGAGRGEAALSFSAFTAHLALYPAGQGVDHHEAHPAKVVGGAAGRAGADA